MRKITLIVLIILVLILLAIFILFNRDTFKQDITNEGISDMTMAIKEGTLTKTSAKIIIEGKNEFSCDTGYSIEKKEKKGWKLMDEIDGYIWGLMGYPSGSDKKINFNLDWSELYGELENGEYRIVKYIRTDGKTVPLYAEFTIE